MSWVKDKGGSGIENFEKGGKVKEAGVIPQVKRAAKEFKKDNPKVTEHIEALGRSVKRTGEFLGDIVTLGGVSRIKAAKKKAKKKPKKSLHI